MSNSFPFGFNPSDFSAFRPSDLFAFKLPDFSAIDSLAKAKLDLAAFKPPELPKLAVGLEPPAITNLGASAASCSPRTPPVAPPQAPRLRPLPE